MESYTQKVTELESIAKSFEGESREVYVNRDKVLKACGLKPGMVVADVGAGTGLYTRLFAKEVGADGQVFAVDIAPKFLEHIQKTSRDAGLKNVSPVLCNFDSVDLPANAVDVTDLPLVTVTIERLSGDLFEITLAGRRVP